MHTYHHYTKVLRTWSCCSRRWSPPTAGDKHPGYHRNPPDRSCWALQKHHQRSGTEKHTFYYINHVIVTRWRSWRWMTGLQNINKVLLNWKAAGETARTNTQKQPTTEAWTRTEIHSGDELNDEPMRWMVSMATDEWWETKKHMWLMNTN